jgi:hypothetical protein
MTLVRLEFATTEEDEAEDELPREAVPEEDDPKRLEAAVKTEEMAEVTAAGRN